MIFSDMRVKDINGVLHYTPQVVKFTAKNRHDHIIGIQLSGNAEHFLRIISLRWMKTASIFLIKKRITKLKWKKGGCASRCISQPMCR